MPGSNADTMVRVRNPMKFGLTFLSLLLLGASAVDGQLRFAHSYGSHMVLQRSPQQALLWGYITPTADARVAANVSVSMDPGGVTVPAVVTGTVWRAVLPATRASLTASYTVTVHDNDTGEQATMEDVLFGDVWVCSGQSNMAFLLEMDMNGTALVADADNYPHIRLFTSQKTKAAHPLLEQPTVEQPWAVGSSVSVSQNSADAHDAPNDDNWLYMSAVCWLYGREIALETGTPVGLVNTNWGGTKVEEWSTEVSFHACPNPPAGGNGELFNGMISPLLNMTIGGVVWYQGEANGGDAWDFVGGPSGKDVLPSYACRFPSMIADWRAKWSAGTDGLTDPLFPFGFVQLAPDDGFKTLPAIRWAQTAGYGYVPNKAMPNTFMAVALDMADPASPYGAVHSRWKQEVGRRLGLGGRAVVYGADVQWHGPIPTSTTQAAGVATVTFDQNITLRTSEPVQEWEVCREGVGCLSSPFNTTDGWEPVVATSVGPRTLELRAVQSSSSVTRVGSGACSHRKQLGRVSSVAECVARSLADSECDHRADAGSISVGKRGGARTGQCICSQAPCGPVTDLNLARDGWDRYSVSGATDSVSSVVAVRYAWSASSCAHLNCSVYSTDKLPLPAAPFFARVVAS